MNPERPKPPLRVLILEDCEEDLFFLLRKLESSGYEADYERVWTEAAARDALRRRPWDIIISDSSLPGFDGLQALVMVKEMGLNIPFVLLSGVISEEKAATAMKAGAFDCIPKNDLDRLPLVIERALTSPRNRSQYGGKGLPSVGEPVIARCRDFRCLAYLDADRKWREYQDSRELPDVIEWFEI
jgi:DNA-binding NtrC family response regulator